MKCFAETVDGWTPLTIFAKPSVFDVGQGSQYTSVDGE